jgi:hypothetical protein
MELEKRITKAERIDDLISTVDDWELEILIDECKHNYKQQLEKMTEEEVIEEWHYWFSRDII